VERARAALSVFSYDAVLFAYDADLKEAWMLSKELKANLSNTRTVLIARWAEEVAHDAPFDAVLRGNHNPRKFLTAVAEVLSGAC
jgi:hypothetical protein